jgi:hypothetical protein
MAQIVDWNTKNYIYYKFINTNVVAFQNLLVLTFKNCFKKVMIASIHYLLNK